MTALDVFLLPGSALLNLILSVFELGLAQQQPLLFSIIAGFISWMIWIVLIRRPGSSRCACWALPDRPPWMCWHSPAPGWPD